MTDWKKNWGYWTSPKTVRTGVYRLKAGGHLVRARVTNPTTGRLEVVLKALPQSKLEEAVRERDALMLDRRDQLSGRPRQRMLFARYAVSLMESKLRAGDIKSEKGKQKWGGVLKTHLLPFFGGMLCSEIRHADCDAFRDELATKMHDGYESARLLKNGELRTTRVVMAASTANTILSVARVVFGKMASTLEVRDPFIGIKTFDESEDEAYTDEEPNALDPEQLVALLTLARTTVPQHYAILILGFGTGKRPSTLRPLRHRGAESDVNWKEGFVRFRRSHTVGDAVMGSTKTKTHEKVYLPASIMQVMREHVALLAQPPLGKWKKPPLWWRKEMAESDLLFPARDGGMRSPSSLDKVFATLGKQLGLPFQITPRSMRRTFIDHARAAEIHDVVTRSITGHTTPAMQLKYSTARQHEQRAAIAKVIDLDSARQKGAG